eukprot:CAMPEP_0176095966 /NCGR_PEP_ID=MMETSP0120_2-20121206/48107_1 /TAXON_ID=160619 /ORGANISM="Kryptoperidinium foliaceum, Strain CCMP 1326" /LENGTH=91 /DNA_ID=CAMNT_0017429947 /DNA_START=154 /DNA_END=426 /DNA_ORIENTATION=+
MAAGSGALSLDELYQRAKLESACVGDALAYGHGASAPLVHGEDLCESSEGEEEEEEEEEEEDEEDGRDADVGSGSGFCPRDAFQVMERRPT